MSEIVLIRHAQASFEAADYDRLSPRGEVQAAKLGAWMAARGARPLRSSPARCAAMRRPPPSAPPRPAVPTRRCACCRASTSSTPTN